MKSAQSNIFDVARAMPQRLFLLLAAFWCGALWATGAMVAPTLFAALEDRQLAGMLAGRLFHAQAWVGLAAGCLLLAIATALVRRGQAAYRPLRWLVLGMMLCALVSDLGLAPCMASLREQAAAQGLTTADTAYRARFGILHGLSSALYLTQSLLGLALLWKTADTR